MGYKLISFDEVDSTNSAAKKLETLEERFTVLVAKEQTDGRGRLGRNWESANGKGLWTSIVFETDQCVDQIATITFVAANAVTALLRKTYGIQAKIKWPNDIFVGEKKICGILVESFVQGKRRIIVGIGLNTSQLNEDFSPELEATSINIELLKTDMSDQRFVFDPKDLLPDIFNAFESELEVFMEECVSGCGSKTTIDNWLAHNMTIGQTVEFEFDGSKKTGEAVGVTPEGHLIINTADGSFIKVRSGEVVMV
ncbi:MAG: biotin--[acetyl-CoA-carboxylase] ligase [Bacillota bacterium]